MWNFPCLPSFSTTLHLGTNHKQKITFAVIGIVVTVLVYLRSDQQTATIVVDSVKEKQNPVALGSFIPRWQHSFELARQGLIQQLKNGYGEEYFDSMFMENGTTSRGKLLFRSPSSARGGEGISWDRLKRRLVRRLLQLALDKSNNNMKKDDTTTSATFVWATGGNSVAAGHGNFVDESYTAVLERAVKDVFAAVDLNFVARNYAMSAIASAPESAWCIDAIFGARDVDMMIWDYALSDGRNLNKLRLFCYRVGVNMNRPPCMAFNIGPWNGRQDVMREVEDRGLTALYWDESVVQAVHESIPDSLGKTAEELEVMPPLVRNFKCGGGLETGEPYCDSEKFNNTLCNNRMWRVKWHPGWKTHALRGNLAALFLVELIGEALSDISKSATSDYEEMVHSFLNEEIANYKQLQDDELPPAVTDVMQGLDDIRMEDIFKTPNFCHTARLPAEIRFRGILGGPPGDIFHHKEGLPWETATQSAKASEFMDLVLQNNDRQDCQVPVNNDHKDFFFVKHADGWKNLILPTAAELEEYGRGQELKGLIAVCFAGINRDMYPAGNLLALDFYPTAFEMQVNGEPVTGLTKFETCSFLRGSQGHYWTPSSDSNFEIRARTIQNDTFLRFGAFIVW